MNNLKQGFLGKITDLMSKMGKINDKKHNNGSKIYPQNQVFLFYFSLLEKTDTELEKEKGGLFYWKWGRNSAPRERQKIPCKIARTNLSLFSYNFILIQYFVKKRL